jgi:radical SAM superfamily enzyme YgiQ (UPF0313 family)
MAMKILLIKPPLNPNLLAPNHDEPLELEYLAAAAAGHDVEILDMRFDRNLDRALARSRPDLVGVTAYTCDFNAAQAILKEVKKSDRNIQTAVGGHHATVLPADFAGPLVDVIFLGPADNSFKEYVNLLDAGQDISAVKNIALVTENGLLMTGKTPFASDLDILPFPDRAATLRYHKHYRDSMRTRTGLIVTSRGCPYRCTFCACWKIMDGRYLARSAESVVNEIATMPEGVELICFADDNTLHSIPRAWRMIQLLRERGVRKRYMMYARADTIVNNPDLMKALKDVGLEYLLVGLESFDDETLAALNKKVTARTNLEAVRLLKKLGIRISPHIIVDPEFRREDFRRLFRYVSELELFRPVYTVLTPLPGTDLYEKNYGRFAIRDYDFFDFTHSVLPTALDRKEFYRQYAALYLKSYSFRRYFLRKFRALAAWVRRGKSALPPDPDRIPFFQLALLIAFAYPMYRKVRRRHRVEPLVRDDLKRPA